jgi:hypothetical protein
MSFSVSVVFIEIQVRSNEDDSWGVRLLFDVVGAAEDSEGETRFEAIWHEEAGWREFLYLDRENVEALSHDGLADLSHDIRRAGGVLTTEETNPKVRFAATDKASALLLHRLGLTL